MATALDPAELQRAFEDLRPRLAVDPIFADGEAGDEDVGVEGMEALLADPPATYEEWLGTLVQHDGGAYLYGGLCTIAGVFHSRRKQVTVDDPLVVDRDDLLFFPDDLRIRGDLLLGDRAGVVVAGDLTIDGNFVGAEWASSLLGVGGTLTVGNLMTPGELVVAGRITVKDVAYFHGEGTARAPGIRARVLIENSRVDRFGDVDAREYLAPSEPIESGPPLQQMCALVSMKRPPDAIDGFEDRLRRRLTAKIPP